jgi:hypothetical protein
LPRDGLPKDITNSTAGMTQNHSGGGVAKRIRRLYFGVNVRFTLGIFLTDSGSIKTEE